MADVMFRDMNEVAEFLRARMDEKGISVRAACAAAQISRSALYQITERATALGADSMAAQRRSLDAARSIRRPTTTAPPMARVAMMAMSARPALGWRISP